MAPETAAGRGRGAEGREGDVSADATVNVSAGAVSAPSLSFFFLPPSLSSSLAPILAPLLPRDRIRAAEEGLGQLELALRQAAGARLLAGPAARDEVPAWTSVRRVAHLRRHE